jgi:N-glycosylase/DNA lyase
MGMKEASHVLRNIGYRGIAIIDRHILTHMVQCGIIADDTVPSSQKKYLEIEAKWLHFASDIRIDPDELDLVFWSLQTGEILK